MKQQEYITIQQARERVRLFGDVEIYNPITLLKKIVGYGVVGVGIASLPLPCGSVFMIMGGCALLGVDYKKLLRTLQVYGSRVLGWVYSHRTKKLRSYNRHLRRLR